MYDENMVKPMREELTRLGIEELRTAGQVDEVLGQKSGTVMVVVNSVCGCSAGGCRPGVSLALKNPKRPARLATVFAGQDREATERARTYFSGHAPSSPAVALMKDGQIVFMLPRSEIEGRNPQQIADSLVKAFNQYC